MKVCGTNFSPREFLPKMRDRVLAAFGHDLLDVRRRHRLGKEAYGRVDSLKVGHYAGKSDFSASPDRPRQFLAPAVWEKLQSLKTKYDPQALFFSFHPPARRASR